MKNIEKQKKIRVCYFGIYHGDYCRNRIFIKGLIKNGVEVIECSSHTPGIKKYFNLIKQHWNIRNIYDVMVVGYPGHQSTILAWFLTSKPIIYDAFVSHYDSEVNNERAVKKHGVVRKYYYWFIDWLSFKFANKIIVDTYNHRDYFSEIFYVARTKFCRIFIGSDDEIFYPQSQVVSNKNFVIHFHGCFNPLQGIPTVIKTAKILENENIIFNLIGEGQKTNDVKKLVSDLFVKNVNFIGNVPHKELKDHLAKAQLSLGVFSRLGQANRVVPNKIYESLASRIAIITSRTPGAEELLTDRKNVLFCNIDDERDLADKILELKNDEKLRSYIADQGYTMFKLNLTPKVLGLELLSLIKSLIKNVSNEC